MPQWAEMSLNDPKQPETVLNKLKWAYMSSDDPKWA